MIKITASFKHALGEINKIVAKTGEERTDIELLFLIQM